jgi:hemerythrin-like domain-containing protein
MLLKIGRHTDHAFDNPLGLLSDCHRRIEQFLSALVTIAQAGRGGMLSPGDRQALESALWYFATASPRHSADEEDSLFPRLRSSAEPEAGTALDALEQLEADHRVAEQHHAAVETLTRRWLVEGTLPTADTDALLEYLAVLDRLYRAHIRVEDEEVFPAAARALAASEIEALGREMAARRDVPFRPSASFTEPTPS